MQTGLRKLIAATLSLLAGVITSSAWALTPTEVAKLLAGDGAASDYFGYSVSVDGDTAVIGAYGDDDNGYHSGSAYVFIRNGTTWSQQAKLLASDGEAGDEFGYSVSVDGDTAVIGAHYGDDNVHLSGSAYVFVNTGNIWSEQAKLLASDGEVGDEFGYSVSVDGSTAVIGANWSDDNGNASGSAYVFVRTGTTWSEQAKLLASDGSVGDFFGYSVSIDGDTSVIGAYDVSMSDIGSAYVFVRTGTTWSEQAKLLASDGAAGDIFGNSVSVDGDTAVIGATKRDGIVPDTGAAYVFVRTATTWSEQAKLLASDGLSNDFFGDSVSVDGDTAVIGAHGNDDNGWGSGSAYVFVRTGATWSEQAKLLASDGVESGRFGISVSVDGDTAVIGAHLDEVISGRTGSAYVFALGLTQPITIDIKPGNPTNRINPRSKGVTAVAVLTSVDFDALQVDPETVRFGPAEAAKAHSQAHVEDVDYDGDMDLLLHFQTQETGIQCGDTEATLTGVTWDGISISGTDSVHPVSCE